MRKPSVTSTMHILPFGNLSPDDFQRLCYRVIEESGEFDNVEPYGMTGDKKRDIIGYKHAKIGKPEKWYFNCKRYKRISAAYFKEELNGIKTHSEENKDFKPEVIVFITACEVSPKCKDTTKEYAKTLSIEPVYFWTGLYLDGKVKTIDKLVNEFFGGGLYSDSFAEKIAEKTAERTAERLTMKLHPSGQLTEVDFISPDEIDKQIVEAVKLINTNKIEDAKIQLNVVLDKIKSKPKKWQNQLVRVYNNLGVCFNRVGQDGGDFDKAEEYFRQSLKEDPNFKKAQSNLASVYLNKGGKDNFKKAYELAVPLWEESDKTEPLFLEILIWSIYHHQSPRETIIYYEKSEEIKSLVSNNPQLLNLMARMHLEIKDFKKAELLVESALRLSPKSPQDLWLKAKILMACAYEEKIIHSLFEVVPKFKNYEDIEKAIESLKEAMGDTKTQNNRLLEEQIKLDIFLCSLWLQRAKEPEYRHIRESIDTPRLSAEQNHQLRILDFAVELEARSFETAYSVLVRSPEWPQGTYAEKTRIAHIFFLRGAPRQSKNILEQLETQAEKKRDEQFYLDMSLNDVLLDNKNLVIAALKKATEFSKDKETEKVVLSNYNSLMYRYTPSGETDRFTEGIFDYDRRYPDDKILTPVRAIDGQGQLTEEIKSLLLEQKDRYESLRQTFKTQPVPSYYLEEVFRRPYASILSFQNDPEFTIELATPNSEFERQLLENLEGQENVVFDYAALLNLSKMGLLGYLSKFNKQLFIAEELFNKIQRELIAVEQEDLRRLWNFLSTSKEVQIVQITKSDLKDKEVPKLFEKWVVDSLNVAKDKSAVFVVDDLRFLNFLRSQDIKGCNSLMILKAMYKERWIDSKIYSTSIGDLAERCYIFLSFTGDDFFQIAMEDNFKIRLRTYHLANQLLLPGSMPASFTLVFVRFIYLLWKTSLLPEDKVQWLKFLTEQVLRFIDKCGAPKDEEDIIEMVPGFIQMWIIAVHEGNKDEITLIEKTIGETLNKSYLTSLRDRILKLIEAKKSGLSKNAS